MIMDARYRLHGITFEWDIAKAVVNLHKHRILFESACEVFHDPFVYVVEADEAEEESRDKAIGMTQNWQLLHVVYTMRGDTIRIVSARMAVKSERRIYEHQ
ncbi:MAG: BrnT family toxin [Anaerolineae bacterium]|jgi:uncharacterized DUF497 family protein|uniref:BrnT family toxin n=2 Tax=Candidatus Amarolinea dominans TaxID=3140696 RepID=UPI0031CCC5AE